MSDTPRTDAKAWRSDQDSYGLTCMLVDAELARTLEREIATEAARAASAEAILEQICALHGCTPEMAVHWCERSANIELAFGKMKAERDAHAAQVVKLREALEYYAGAPWVGGSTNWAHTNIAQRATDALHG